MPYSPAAGVEICRRLVGGETLTAICRTPVYAPKTPATVHKWLESNEEFRRAYWHARRQQAVIWADQTIDMADAATLRDHHVVRLRIDTRKWFASRLYPQLLGDRVAHQQLDARGEPTDPVQLNVVQVAVERLGPADLAEFVRLLDLVGASVTGEEQRQIAARPSAADDEGADLGAGGDDQGEIEDAYLGRSADEET